MPKKKWILANNANSVHTSFTWDVLIVNILLRLGPSSLFYTIFSTELVEKKWHVMPFTFKSIYASFPRIRLVSWITIVIDFSNSVRIQLCDWLFIFQFCQWPINVLHSIFLPSRIEFSLGFAIFLVSLILNISFDLCTRTFLKNTVFPYSVLNRVMLILVCLIFLHD